MDGSSGDEPRSWQKRDGKEEEKKNRKSKNVSPY